MTSNRSKKAKALFATSLLVLGTVAQAADKRPVVVELFTSQGCSSCPPANANLTKLSGRSDVLALSFAVTYWDYLGWKDIFGKPEFTNRQVVYEPALGEQGPFTPQMVINGRDSNVGFRIEEVERLIDNAEASRGPLVVLTEDHQAKVSAGETPSSAADVWLVQYDPKTVEVPIRRGENSGATLPHTNVVRSLQHLGLWRGVEASFAFPATPEGLRTAILVQAPDGGPILAAVTD